MKYKAAAFEPARKTDNMVMLISKPASKISTRIVAASTKEEELGTLERFLDYMKK